MKWPRGRRLQPKHYRPGRRQSHLVLTATMSDLLSTITRRVDGNADDGQRERMKRAIGRQLKMALADVVSEAIVQAEQEAKREARQRSKRSSRGRRYVGALALLGLGVLGGYALAGRRPPAETYESVSQRIDDVSENAGGQLQEITEQATEELERRAAEQRGTDVESDEGGSSRRRSTTMLLVSAAATAGAVLLRRRRSGGKSAEDSSEESDDGEAQGADGAALETGSESSGDEGASTDEGEASEAAEEEEEEGAETSD